MKKKLLFMALAIGLAMPVTAQTVFEENFDDGNVDGWNFIVANGENMDFGLIASMPAMAGIGFESMALAATTFQVVGQQPVHIDNVDLMIMTPVISLPEGDTFITYKAGSLIVTTGSAHYSVYVLTAEELEGITTGAQLSTLLNTKVADDSADVSGESSVTSFSTNEYGGQDIRVVFRLHDTTANALLLFDDFMVKQGTLSTHDAVAQQFTVHPNPAGDMVTITVNSGLELNNVTVTDLNGRVVLQQNLNSAAAARVDVSSLNSGVYVMLVTSDKGTTTKKIIKQ